MHPGWRGTRGAALIRKPIKHIMLNIMIGMLIHEGTTLNLRWTINMSKNHTPRSKPTVRCAAFTLVAVPVPTLIGTTNAARTNATNPKAGRTRINNPIGMAMTNPTTSDESCVESRIARKMAAIKTPTTRYGRHQPGCEAWNCFEKGVISKCLNMVQKFREFRMAISLSNYKSREKMAL